MRRKRKGHESKEQSENNKAICFFSVCQSPRPAKGREAIFSPWISQSKISSRSGTISRLPSFSLTTTALVKIKRVKFPRKSLKEEQPPVVRTAHTNTPLTSLSAQGFLPVCSIATVSHISHPKSTSSRLKINDSSSSLYAFGQRALCALLCTNVSLTCPKQCSYYYSQLGGLI